MGAQNIYQKDKGYERSTPREEWVEERRLIIEQYSHINIGENVEKHARQ